MRAMDKGYSRENEEDPIWYSSKGCMTSQCGGLKLVGISQLHMVIGSRVRGGDNKGKGKAACFAGGMRL
jgi:hypothetical protein